MRIVFPEGSGCVQSPQDLQPVKALGTVDYYDKPPQNKQDLIERLRAFGLTEKIGTELIFPTLPTAVDGYLRWAREHPASGPS